MVHLLSIILFYFFKHYATYIFLNEVLEFNFEIILNLYHNGFYESVIVNDIISYFFILFLYYYIISKILSFSKPSKQKLIIGHKRIRSDL